MRGLPGTGAGSAVPFAGSAQRARAAHCPKAGVRGRQVGLRDVGGPQLPCPRGSLSGGGSGHGLDSTSKPEFCSEGQLEMPRSLKTVFQFVSCSSDQSGL